MEKFQNNPERISETDPGGTLGKLPEKNPVNILLEK